MQAISRRQVTTCKESVEEPLPPGVQEALGQLVAAAKEGLLALSVGVGLGVLDSLMAEEVEEVCGPRGEQRSGPGRVPARDRRRAGGHGRWPARAGHPSADAQQGWRGGGAVPDLRELRQP
jgi:hypothetical protein